MSRYRVVAAAAILLMLLGCKGLKEGQSPAPSNSNAVATGVCDSTKKDKKFDVRACLSEPKVNDFMNMAIGDDGYTFHDQVDTTSKPGWQLIEFWPPSGSRHPRVHLAIYADSSKDAVKTPWQQLQKETADYEIDEDFEPGARRNDHEVVFCTCEGLYVKGGYIVRVSLSPESDINQDQVYDALKRIVVWVVSALPWGNRR